MKEAVRKGLVSLVWRCGACPLAGTQSHDHTSLHRSLGNVVHPALTNKRKWILVDSYQSRQPETRALNVDYGW